MEAEARLMLDDDQTTALVIEHQVKRGFEERYKEWLSEIFEASKTFPGYLGREVFPPAGALKPYIIIVRFATERHLQQWLDSPERKAFIEKMEDALEVGDKTFVKAGIDVWFTPNDAPNKPPAYKQFLLTAAAIYPLSLFIPQLLSPLFKTVPVFENSFVRGLVVTLVLVGLMTYIVMPRLTLWLHDWLFRQAEENK
jgi:antibiotic biosynthesis monooxygenase (ABM) superfamily enzyme